MTVVREELERLMRETLLDEAVHRTWTYRAVRPMPVPASWKPGQHVQGDCSKGVQYLCKWGHAPDPMGNGFSDYGNSTTLCVHLRHLDHPRDLQIGDIVTFGENGDEHAAMVLEEGDDPLLWSFGHQGAPNTYRLSQDHRPHQLLRLPAPAIPTTQQELRERTGYWAWLAWRLGEGDWRAYGQASPSVRPNVPKRIPLSWWRRLARFLLARKKANPKGTTA